MSILGRARSAVTGRFVSSRYAERHPSTTVTEDGPRPRLWLRRGPMTARMPAAPGDAVIVALNGKTTAIYTLTADDVADNPGIRPPMSTVTVAVHVRKADT